MTAMLVGYSLRRIHGARGAMEIVFAVPPALVGLYLFYVPTFRGFLPALHLLPFWLFTVCWGIYFMERRWFVSGIFLGLCVISRPYLAAVAPFFLLWCCWNWRANKHGVL